MLTKASRLVTVRIVVAMALVASAGATLPITAQQPFKVEARWKVSGDGSWDYLTVDSAARRLYIAHQTEVDVIDLATGNQIGTVTESIEAVLMAQGAGA